MAVCMDSRFDHHTYGMASDSYPSYSCYPSYTYDNFDSDFYKCLCEDLAKELDFPEETDLRRISQLELFGSSWETDPYKKILLRCLDHSIPRLREPILSTPRSRGGSIDSSAMDENLHDLDFELEEAAVPTNPPPSPVLSAVGYVLSSQHGAESSRQEPLFFDKLQLLAPAEVGEGSVDLEGDDTDGEDEDGAWIGLAAGEITEARRIRRQKAQIGSRHHQYHRRVASTGLLATVVAGDGSIKWHFKEFS
ncbi:hypothetical protein ABW20_dc0108559 [Dactylellina cionopaga]|nr:hypothetical protein ABW20_dc0108559 [Dactylellina cionopaga]